MYQPVFFQNATQALQALHDNTVLVDEVLKQNNRLHIPFVNADGTKFIASILWVGGPLSVVANDFSNDDDSSASDGDVFILPQ